jgi:predicted RNase H-like HicB family nuclease
MNLARQIRYPILVERDPFGFRAYSPDLPGCFAQGSTPEEAIARLKEEILARIRSKLTGGEPLPEPSATAWVYVPLI